ncbi:hypothetical protein RDWZM_000280 [Blomia tropicalis]|uniref:Uncharacterized protein n=1 Tax=Blomia tropicalis TaxID=40697 RepID=A0A9Q0MDD2_BLOTA|nr:hypothetical protein RDWZM_000280 [Blomia tropicalis]
MNDDDDDDRRSHKCRRRLLSSIRSMNECKQSRRTNIKSLIIQASFLGASTRRYNSFVLMATWCCTGVMVELDPLGTVETRTRGVVYVNTRVHITRKSTAGLHASVNCERMLSVYDKATFLISRSSSAAWLAG